MAQRVHAAPPDRAIDRELIEGSTSGSSVDRQSASIILLQQSAGNAATAGYLSGRRSRGAYPEIQRVMPVQRCGPTPCSCSEEERTDYAVAHADTEDGTLASEQGVQRLAERGSDEVGPTAQRAISTPAAAITGTTAAIYPAATLPAGERLCFPPGPIMGPQWGSGFGTIAERLIELDYCDTLGCTPATEYIDNNNPTAYLTFMRTHNPSLTSPPGSIALALASATGIARPDIMTDRPGRQEYYEIKPFSPDGVGAGMEKLVEIMAFMASLSLPYRPGTAYSPSKDIPIWSGVVLGEPLGVALNVQRPLPGLVLYSLCLSGNLSALLAKVALAALLAWLIAEILTAVAPVVVLA